MIILIDAYNLLKQLHATDLIADRERDAYIALLNRYSKLKRHTIILLFDGGFFDMPSRQKEGRVMVVYAGRNQTADQAIKDYLDNNYTKDLLLVTADRELKDHAHKLDVLAIDPLVFDSYVQQAINVPSEKRKAAIQQPQKLRPEKESDQLDELMEQASATIVEKPDEEDIRTVSLRHGKSAALSKKDRKLMAKLSKL